MHFQEVYQPVKALVIYQSDADSGKVYVEAYDMDGYGKPVNAHPLTVHETIALAECFNTSADLNINYLKSEGLLPANVLYINPDKNGFAIWYTKPQKASVLFVDDLGIPSGTAEIPALIWKADKSTLRLYALKSTNKPDADTALYYAPFFNMYENNAVCMGTVEVKAGAATCLEDFIEKWQSYFWNSYFSHLINEESPVNGNIVQLWQKLVGTGCKFPTEVLKKNGKQLKDVL